jgi:hypothetical protein
VHIAVFRLDSIIPSTRLMDISYVSVLEYEFFASLWKPI